jgi:hypothetical protein
MNLKTTKALGIAVPRSVVMRAGEVIGAGTASRQGGCDEPSAAEAGEATLRQEPSGGPATTAVVKYVVVWKRVGGQWRLHRDIWNAMPAK